MSTRPPTRRTVLTGLALATTGATLSRKLPALDLSVTAHAPIDPMRPQYHLLPTHGWMNDPCGPIYWKGRYHMFYQYNSEPISAVKLWAHATSSDMVHWRREPIALAPTPGGPDADGCWTGTAAIVDGKPTFLYTGVVNSTPEQATLADSNPPLRESVCMAVAEDDALLHWRKLPQPVIPAPPAGMKVVGFRDPSPWREGNHWNLIVASGERGAGGRVLLYRSADFLHWDYLHPMAQGKPNGKQGTDPVDSGEMWECPDFFPPRRQTRPHPFHGTPHSLADRHARPSDHALSRGERRRARSRRLLRAQIPARCAGQPHPLGLDHRDAPASRVRRRRLVRHDVAAAPSLHRKWAARHGPVTGDCVLRTAPRTGSAVRRLPSAAQEIRLTLEPEEVGSPSHHDFVDSQGTVISIRTGVVQKDLISVNSVNIPGDMEGPLNFQIFLDHSVAEIFVDQHHVVTQRYYERNVAEPAVTVRIANPCRIVQQEAWSLKSIW